MKIKSHYLHFLMIIMVMLFGFTSIVAGAGLIPKKEFCVTNSLTKPLTKVCRGNGVCYPGSDSRYLKMSVREGLDPEIWGPEIPPGQTKCMNITKIKVNYANVYARIDSVNYIRFTENRGQNGHCDKYIEVVNQTTVYKRDENCLR